MMQDTYFSFNRLISGKSRKNIFFILSLASLIAFGSNAGGGIIFQDDFNANTDGWKPTVSSALRPFISEDGVVRSAPEDQILQGWNGHSIDPRGGLEVVENEGRNNSPALKITYPPGNAYTKINLIKWLGNEIDTSEIYIKYWMKFKDSGEDRWRWGDGTQGSFSFIKLMRNYQGVDLYSVKYSNETGYAGQPAPSIHPSSYPDYFIPDFGNAGQYGERPIIPNFYHTCGNNQVTGGGVPNSIWRNMYSYSGAGTGVNLNASMSPNDPESDHVCGPIYTVDEDPELAGYFKNPQDWHSIEYHLKLTNYTLDTENIPASFIDEWSVKLSGNLSDKYTAGDFVLCNDTGQSFIYGSNKPVLHKIETVSFDGTDTVLQFEHQNSIYGPHLTDSITSVTKITAIEPGIIESWIDGMHSGNYYRPEDSNVLHNSNLGGGFNLLQFGDNLAMTRSSSISFYIDDVTISTTRVDTIADAIVALQVVAGVIPAGDVTVAWDVDGDSRIGLAEAIHALKKAAADPKQN